MKATRIRVLGAIATSAVTVAYATYRREIRAARRRIESNRQVIELPQGPIEFAESGDGPAALFIHGAGGGFDQGSDIGRVFLGHARRIIAPSRFGYLGTPLPHDASPEAQADAYARLLDALKLETVPVIAVSAGAPSAMQFALRHPDRCSALVLVVPLAHPAKNVTAGPPSPLFEAVLTTVASSDFAYWAATKFARLTLVKTILGTPVADYRNGTAVDQMTVDLIMRGILPISRRTDGLRNDSEIGSALQRYPLEDITAPALVIGVENCLYGTYASSVYTADHIPGAKLVTYRTGGHLLLGHIADVRREIGRFLITPRRASLPSRLPRVS